MKPGRDDVRREVWEVQGRSRRNDRKKGDSSAKKQVEIGETPKRYYYTSYGGLRVIYNDTVKAAKITREVWERSLGGTRQK